MQMKRVMWPASILLAATVGACGSSDKNNGGVVNPNTGVDPMMMQPGVMAGSGGTAAPVDMMAGAAAPTEMMPVAGNTGSAGTAPQPEPDAGTMMPDTGGGDEDIRGKCEINSGFPGDDACLLPPAAGEGMQIHIGPSNYDDPAEIDKFRFTPGSESSECWSFHTPNTEDIYYQTFVLSGRPGTHHIINTMYSTDHADGTTFTLCRDPGTGTTPDILANLPGASKAYMPRRPVAPENANLGRPIPANTASQADMHYFNFTQEDILREFWMNIYYVPKEQVEMEPLQIRGMGGIGWQIAPGTDKVYQYSAPITQDGRIIELLGHYHAHGVRFAAYLQRATGEQMKVFEMYDYLDPLIFSYNSITTNPEFSDNAGGAYTGILEVKAGDTLQWECHIINDSQATLDYSNAVETGEMCNLWGATVGPNINSVLFFETPF
jgi:hypothetical protein